MYLSYSILNIFLLICFPTFSSFLKRFFLCFYLLFSCRLLSSFSIFLFYALFLYLSPIYHFSLSLSYTHCYFSPYFSHTHCPLSLNPFLSLFHSLTPKCSLSHILSLSFSITLLHIHCSLSMPLLHTVLSLLSSSSLSFCLYHSFSLHHSLIRTLFSLSLSLAYYLCLSKTHSLLSPFPLSHCLDITLLHTHFLFLSLSLPSFSFLLSLSVSIYFSITVFMLFLKLLVNV